MNTNDLTITFSVDQTPEQAFAAINDVASWWSGGVEGSTTAVGDEYSYRVPDLHYSAFRVTEFEPPRRVAWLVTDSYLGFTKDPEEWTGTTVLFDVAEVGGRTQVTFTHEGITPEVECYDVCSTAWSDYITQSLRARIESGSGLPGAFSGEEFVEDARQRGAARRLNAQG
ncbi:SRPBCC family protein [Ornithinimicrobium murale]|uniref:SRPBCC family protein n=1 Tax=Ornithinimicrobium murale TaxID=1050153 RepID=UPI000E0DD4E8|nr:SRPBCC domain-containing protein [Ornithinimicrobium murale]